MYYGTATNCVLWGNAPNESYYSDVSYSCLSVETEGAANIFENPGFVNPLAGDFRLRAGSPCVDSGTADGAPSTDALDRPRPQGASVDMGAYEYYAGDDDHAVAPPPVLRVNAASTVAEPDGLSWATAYPALQPAANLSGYGGEIWVAAGTYTADNGEEVVKLPPGTALFGGFAGTETAREQRDVNANLTIIDGQGARRGVTANAAALVDGFTLQNGHADRGGGLWGGGTAANCTFAGNTASASGGGMCEGTAANCTFTGNTAVYGGGMRFGTAANCTFTGNTAVYGGGMQYGTATNCTFAGNTASASGGGMCEGTAANCTFTGNTATDPGGGMRNGTATNCVLWGNAPMEAYYTEVSYSCLSATCEGTGNIAGNPGFVNPLAGDFRLRFGSPCVDAGTADNAPSMDLLNRARPQGAGVDMGAYEYYAGDDDHAAAPPPVLRVSAGSTAAEPDGLSWATAYSALQPAANLSGYGGEIWVAAGTYTADNGEEVVKLPPGTALFGGFVGTETAREQRDVNANLTIIDGQDARRGVTANAAALVDGFTLQNGRATNGGGMHGGMVADCTFTKNTARGYNASGGGAYLAKATNCVFSANSADYGGGMSSVPYIPPVYEKKRALLGKGLVDKSGELFVGTATNCTFTGNTATHSGGGICGGTATNCVLWGNAPMEAYYTEVSYSCLSAIWTYMGAGNIGADPLFVDAAAGDFRLQAGSPCIDTGTADGAPAGDMLGVPRPQGAGVDMGAYEMLAVTMPDVVGLARTAARQLVAAAQLYVRDETEEYHPTIPVGHVVHQNPAAGVQVLPSTPVNLTLSKGPTPVSVPEVTGQTQSDAAATLTDAGLVIGSVTQQHSLTVPVGTVVSQSVAAGTPVLPGAAIDLVVSRGGITVPDVAGKPQSAAAASVGIAGLVVGTVTQQYGATVPVGAVISQTPAAGTPVLPGTPVDLVISRGVQPAVMPDIVGQPRAQAEAAITGAGLALGLATRYHSNTVAAGSIISQNPGAGSELPPGTAVSIVESLGAAPAAEGEGEHVDTDTARRQLADAHDTADTDGDGRLAFDEAMSAAPGLTRAMFDEIDINRDGQLTSDELAIDDASGCAGCRGGKSTFSPKPMGDLFLMALGALGLAAMSTLRK
jgi:parallel beta-helix repeat protein/predicted outer membrane repeat protein